MKQIEGYPAPKYEGGGYSLVEDGIYRAESSGGSCYVTSLSFVQEPELGEGHHAGEISQYPLEDLLDAFFCHISDFYEELNREPSQICYQEFAASDLECIKKLRRIIGRHVYNRELNGSMQLVIE